MLEEKSDRLRKARENAGYKSASAAARQFDWPEAGYRHHENGTRGFGLDAAKKYGRAFKVKPGWLLCVDGVDNGAPRDFTADDFLLVENAVAAGVWREPSLDYPNAIKIDIPAPVPATKRFGLVVEGSSMDLHYEPGTVLDCISIYANGTEPISGDHVIVQREKPDGLRELTVKEIFIENGSFVLKPKSSDQSYKDMVIGSPDGDCIDGDQVSVIGFVVSAISPRALGLLERLGKIEQIGVI